MIWAEEGNTEESSDGYGKLLDKSRVLEKSIVAQLIKFPIP
jgi:hypothetical protein